MIINEYINDIIIINYTRLKHIMGWTALDDGPHAPNQDDMPRRLSVEEIEYIVSHLPLALSADAESALLNRKNVMRTLSDALRGIELCPSAIPELIKRLVDQHNRSLVIPGTPVGVTASEAVGATSTQMTLNTFHQSGSSKSASFGIETLKDFVYARKTPKNDSCTIYFKNMRASFEEVLDFRRIIVGSVIKDFVTDYEIKPPTSLKKFWWNEGDDLLEKKVPVSEYVMRLHLNVGEMYKHRVTIADLAHSLEAENPSSVVALYGPMTDGIIDLYPDIKVIGMVVSEKFKGVKDNMLELTFFENIVWPSLPSIRVKGIAGIKSLVPIVSPTWRAVLVQRKLEMNDLNSQDLQTKLGKYVGSAWILSMNNGIMLETGLVSNNIAALCELAAMDTVHVTVDQVIVNMPKGEENTEPKTLIDKKVKSDKDIRQTRIKELTDEMMEVTKNPKYTEAERRTIRRRPINVPRTPIMIASEFVIAETEGSNLLEIMALPEVDSDRTICSNMYTITEVLGCEAAFNFIIQGLFGSISGTGSYVHPTHIKLIAEFIMSRGYPYGATYTGISRQPGGHLSLATLERAGTVFAKSALHGRREDLRNASAAITVGTRISIGDGCFDIGQNIEINGKPKRVLNDDLFTALKQDDLTKNEMGDLQMENGVGPGRGSIDNVSLEHDFDVHGGDESASVVGMFASNVIADLRDTRPIEPIMPKKFTKVQPEEALDPNEMDELLGVLDEINNLEIEPIKKEQDVITVNRTVQSDALISEIEMIPVGLDYTSELEMMMKQYQSEVERSTLGQQLPLPTVEPLVIAGLEGQNIGVTRIEARKVQLQGLTIIKKE